MKLNSPTIYVPHKIGTDWAKSTFSFDGTVDRRRVRREIVRSFKRGGERVSTQYVDACINSSLNTQMITASKTVLALPDDSAQTEDD